MRPLVVVGALISVSTIAGCPTDPAPPEGPACTLVFLGDKSTPVVLEIVARGIDGKSRVIRDGDAVPLVYPPQGGRVVFVGVRATNLDACAVKLTGSIRDETTGQLRLDARTINLLPTGDGWGASLDVDIATFSNIPMCPNQWASADVFDHDYQLTLSVIDKAGRAGQQTIRVTPKCAEPDRATECFCICKQGYKLGESCADAGPPADSGLDADDTNDASDASEASDVGGGGG